MEDSHYSVTEKQITAEHLKQQLLLRGVLKLLKVDTPVFVNTAAQVALES